MAIPSVVNPGQTVSTSQRFLRGGSPLLVSEPIKYIVSDMDGLVVARGSATQDVTTPEQWDAIFVVPSHAQSGTYEITWIAKPLDTRVPSLERTETFQVAAAPAETEESTVAVYAGDQLTDTLVLDQEATNVRVRFFGPDGNQIGNSTQVSGNPYNEESQWVYQYNGPILEDSGTALGILPYGIHWVYQINGERQLLTRSVFVLDHIMISHIEALKQHVDLYRNPSIRITDLQYAHFIIQGLQRINAQPPATTTGLNSLSQAMMFPLQRAALAEVLNALFLAESMSAFEFNGQSTQLTMDRTQGLESKKDEINEWLNTNLPLIKRDEARRRVAGGVLGVSMGPASNWGMLNGPPNNLINARLQAGLARIARL